MKKWNQKLCCGLVSAALLGALAVPAAAAGYSDLKPDHWAFSNMDYAARIGLIKGVGGDRMAPDQQLTRGQFLVLLARVYDGKGYMSAVEEGQPWDQAAFDMALEEGLLREDDFLPVSDGQLKEPITRQEVAVLLDRLLPSQVSAYVDSFELPEDPIEESLLDWEDMDADYKDAVGRLYELGVVKGNDKKEFGGTRDLRRCDGSVLVMRALMLISRLHHEDPVPVVIRFVDQQGQIVSQEEYEGEVLQGIYWGMLDRVPYGYELTEAELPVSLTYLYTVIDVKVRQLSQQEIEYNELEDRYYSGDMTPEEEQAFELRMMGGNPSKSELLFGNSEQYRFDDQATAEASMGQATFPVWRMGRDGNKYSDTATITVNQGLVADVEAIFTEIYNDPEQFPIQYVGGYRWGDGGEHTCGSAIDINANENYQIKEGTIIAGSYWKPGEDPLSIPEDGSVVRIFASHGWSWGGTAWAHRDNHDYMHFSYMGT